MKDVFIQMITVPQTAIDLNGHVSNLEYLRWMQEIATSHSAEQGWPLERYIETQTSWVIKSHFIEYLRPVYAGQEILLLTWIARIDLYESSRRYLFWRADDKRVLAKAETVWVFVNAKSGRRARIPDDFRSAFALVTNEVELLKQLESGSVYVSSRVV